MGVSKPCTAVVNKAIKKYELSRHCRRRTRGTQETIRLIESLFSTVSLNDPSGNLPIVLRNAFRLDPKGDFEAPMMNFNFEQT